VLMSLGNFVFEFVKLLKNINKQTAIKYYR